MKNRIARTKQFVHDNSHKLSAAAGLAVGVAVTYQITKTPALQNLKLNITTDQIHKLLETPGSYVEFNAPSQMIELVVDGIQNVEYV